MEELHEDQRRLLQEVSRAPDEGVWRDRYSRQIRFAPLGREGQDRLRHARVLIVGVGALGSHLADAIVRAGVGAVWLVDRDLVEHHNLPRQILFDEADATHGRPKASAAAAQLRSVNSACAITAIDDEFTVDTMAEHGIAVDLILDGTDNFATRYLINDLAMQRRVPWIYGAALGAEGMAMAVVPGQGPCLRCILPEPPTGNGGTCDTDGILQPTIAMVTAFQIAQAVKILSGRADTLARGVFVVDVWRNVYGLQLQGVTSSEACPTCTGREFPALSRAADTTVSLCGRDAIQVRLADGTALDLDVVATRLSRAGIEVTRAGELLRFTADGCKVSLFPSGRALLFGIADPKRALTLYDRWVGGR